MDRFGGGRVLDQLDQLVAMHNLAGGHGQVFAGSKGLLISHRQLARRQVTQEMLSTLDQVPATTLDGLVDDLRVGEERVGGADRIDELAQIELEFALLRPVEPLNLCRRLEQ